MHLRYMICDLRVEGDGFAVRSAGAGRMPVECRVFRVVLPHGHYQDAMADKMADDQARWESGGNWWEENFDFAQEMERGGKTVKKFPAKVGMKTTLLLGKWREGGNFPAFPGVYPPLECGIGGNQED
jgi:hypothetical protein